MQCACPPSPKRARGSFCAVLFFVKILSHQHSIALDLSHAVRERITDSNTAFISPACLSSLQQGTFLLGGDHGGSPWDSDFPRSWSAHNTITWPLSQWPSGEEPTPVGGKGLRSHKRKKRIRESRATSGDSLPLQGHTAYAAPTSHTDPAVTVTLMVHHICWIISAEKFPAQNWASWCWTWNGQQFTWQGAKMGSRWEAGAGWMGKVSRQHLSKIWSPCL